MFCKCIYIQPWFKFELYLISYVILKVYFINSLKKNQIENVLILFRLVKKTHKIQLYFIFVLEYRNL